MQGTAGLQLGVGGLDASLSGLRARAEGSGGCRQATCPLGQVKGWGRQGPAGVLQAAGMEPRQQQGQALLGLQLGSTVGVH